MTYYTDFVTGRTLLPGEPVTAFVVAPVIHNAFPKHRAHHPLHEQDHFEPLSLPIQGTLEGEEFTPDPDQQSLKIWLEFVSLANWKEFQDKHLRNKDTFELGRSKMINSWNGESPKREIIFATAFVHTSTLKKLVEIAFSKNNVDHDATEATAMMLDARERIATGNFSAKSGICYNDHDPKLIASLANFGSPREACYMPLAGWWIYTPSVMGGFFSVEAHPIPVSEHLVGSVKSYHEKHDSYSKDAVTQTYRDAGLFYRFMSALDCLGHIVQPSKRIMYDNRLETARVALNDLTFSLTGISNNTDIFADWIAHVKYPHLLDIRSKLASILERLDLELPAVHKGSKYKEPNIFSYESADDDESADEGDAFALVEDTPKIENAVAKRKRGIFKLNFWKR